MDGSLPRCASVVSSGSVLDAPSSPSLVAVDLFSGAGGLSLAFHRAGFHIAAAVEQDENAAATYKKSFIEGCSPTTRLLQCDVREAAVLKTLEVLRNTNRRIDIVIGGPPCQDFSPARLKAPRKGRRTNLVRRYFEILDLLNPRAFLFENVPGFRTARRGIYWDVVEEEAHRLGYEVFAEELNAEDFGVPQRRRRLFVVGLKALGEFSFPAGSGDAPTVMQIIGNLRPLQAGEFDPNDEMHRARCHRPWMIDYLSRIKEGQAWRDVKDVRILRCHQNWNGHYDVYGRMKGDDVAPTMTGGCTNPSKGRFIHPRQHRGLTVREAALLQTFPGDWQFYGGIEAASQQVGNAVPVKLGETLAKALRNVLEVASTGALD